MATIRQPSTITVDSSTVSGPVGLCFFDEESETLKEFSSVTDLMLAVEPGGVLVKKFYIVTDPASILSYVKIFIETDEQNKNAYSVKLIVSESEPPIDAFDILPSYNAFMIQFPQVSNFIPVWILVENISKVNEAIDVDFVLEYE